VRILVTGGAGFIGSGVAAAYLQAGHDVVVVDNLSTGRRDWVPAGACFYEMDVTDPGLERVFADHRFDVVNHHAAQVSVTRSVTDPAGDARTNILGSLALLGLAVRFRVRRFIFASSCAVYGQADRRPTPESAPLRPLSPYGLAKRVVEDYLRLYGELTGLEWVALRYANVYGPRAKPHTEAGVVTVFITQMLRGERPTIFGDGRQTRDFIHVDDVVDANLRALDRGAGPINIGTGRETSILGLFRMLARMIGFEAPPVFAPARPGEVRFSSLDRTLAGEVLGWSPRVDLAEGLVRVVDTLRGGVG
jgi:UDP-glucose 4-epimerase